MYVWQMNDGRWHISAYTDTAFHVSQFCQSIDRGFETRKEADAALSAWRKAGGVAEYKWKR